MFPDVTKYNPQEQDYRFWLVVNPSTWLMPMLISLLVLGIAVHAAVFSIAPSGMLFVNDGAAPVAVEAAAPVAVEAAAPAAEAPAAEAPAAEAPAAQ